MLKIKAFYTFLSRLSKKEKMIFYLAVFFVSLALLDHLIVSPISSKINSLNKEIQEKELAIKKFLHLIVLKDKILAESKKYSSLVDDTESQEEEMTSILKEIENLANKTSVYLIDMKPAGFKETGSAKKYQINLNCEAQMEQLTDFMYSIENSNKLLTIEKYQLSPKSKESSVVRCSMSISKIVMP